MLPLFLLLKSIGLVNTYAGVLVPVLATIFGIALVRQYALSIPDEMLEAARVDGASEFRIFVSIVVPTLTADTCNARHLHFSRNLERLHVAAHRSVR